MNNDTIVAELDKPRILKFRRKELKMLEQTFKTKITKIKFDDISIDDLSKITRLALIHEDPDLTLEQTEELIDEYPHYGVLLNKVMEAFRLAMEGPKETTQEIPKGDPSEEKN